MASYQPPVYTQAVSMVPELAQNSARTAASRITSDRVVTGTNVASGRSATERRAKLFDSLEPP